MALRDVLDLIFDPACLTDPQGRLLHVNEAFVDWLGGLGADSPPALPDMIGRSAFHDLARGASQEKVLLRRLKAKGKDGQSHPMEARCLRLKDSGEFILVLRPTTAGAPAEGLEHMALHDALTGLPNRVLLLDRLRQTLVRSKRHGDFSAVVFIDLDGFKSINDTFGHDCGDEVLRATASRLLGLVRGEDTAARIGGDEFVVVLGELKNGLHAGITGNRILKAVTRPIAWNDRSVGVSASLGISVAPTDGTQPEELLGKADEAMYVAKKSGKNGYSFYNESSYFE